MASPQLENGHLKIANELIEAILAADLGRREQKVVWAIIRKTYGFNRKADAISTSQIAGLTGIDRADVARTLRGLVARKIVTAEPSGVYRHGVEVQKLGVNKDHEAWETGGKPPPVGQGERVVKHHGWQTTTGGESPPVTGGKPPAGTGGKPPPTKDRKDRKDREGSTRARANGSPARPDDISEQTWLDFLSVRKARKAPLTQTAWNRIAKELDLAAADGWPRDDALAEAVTAGWQGFRYDWLKRRMATTPGKGNGETIKERAARIAAETPKGQTYDG